MTFFNIGERVTATVTAQGMVAGKSYLVVHSDTHPTPFSSLVTYWLGTVGDPLMPAFAVGNLHMLARAEHVHVPKLTPKQADAARRRERAAERRDT